MHVFSTPYQAQATGYTGGRRSPGAVGAAVAIHVAVATAIIMMPGMKILPKIDTPFTTYAVPPDKTPPEQQKRQPEKAKGDRSVLVPKPDTTVEKATDTTNTLNGGDGGLGDFPRIDTEIKPVDPPVPVMIPASFDPSRIRDLQPPYPAQMIRAQMEGSVTVRVTIGTDGRVQSIDLVSADNPAFWEATRKQALRYWRFRPATRDGVAITTDKTLTVHFRLNDL